MQTDTTKKKKLFNIYDKETLKKIRAQEGLKRKTLSFYQYYHIKNPQFFRNHFYDMLDELHVLGRIYVSYEGVNAQISVPETNLDTFKSKMDEITFLNGIRLNYAIEEPADSFLKLKIKVRQKIVADGLQDETFDVTNKGVHLKASEFNEITNSEDTIVVDMRNHYESEIGHFENAITPDVVTFREALDVVEEELKDKKDKNLVMYCTGGIRCEKASAYYKHKGFKNVYQLEGGIIEYARQVKQEGLENKFLGKNFVFDDRMAEQISQETISQCHQCGEPWDVHTNCANDACHLLFLQCDKCSEKHQACCSEECVEFNEWPLEERKAFKKGHDFGVQIYKKGRESNFVKVYQEWKKQQGNTSS